MRRRLIPAAIAIALALALGACGGSSSSNVGIVSKAAVNTSRLHGYRVAGTINILTSGRGTIRTFMGLAGTFNRTNGLGRFLTVGLVNGRRFEVSELVSPLAVYTGASAIPNGTRLTGGKQWLKLDLSQAIRASALSSLPTESDPTQFVDYLRAVSSATSSKGLEPVRGVQSAHYHATVNLDRYPDLVPKSRRATVQRSIKALEAALGSHSLPVDVWIDQFGLVRRLRVAFDECVARTRFSFAMVLDLYAYGPQPTPKLPSARQAYDLTPLISKALSRAKLGCKR